MKLRSLTFLLLFSAWTLVAQTRQELVTVARSFPVMPTEASGISQLNGTEVVVAAGAPYNDLEWTVFDTGYIDGETNGYDTFCPVDPSKQIPGQNRINLVECSSQTNTDVAYQGDVGDRIILGSKRTGLPFFRKGADRLDNDYLIIKHFDYNNGHIELPGTATEYRLLTATVASDGVATTGSYLFYIADGDIDLIAFIFPCTEVPEDTTSANRTYWCNASQSLSLADRRQFRFVGAVSDVVSYDNGLAQEGGLGKEVIASTATDELGNTYLFGLTDSNLNPNATGSNEILVVKILPDGTTDWVFEYPSEEGTLFFDGTVDDDYVYAAGRTFGSLPGFQNVGRWDGIIMKIDKESGRLVNFTQYGQQGIDGFGNIVKDDAGNLYVSGAGAPLGAGLGDNVFLTAKYDAETLEQQWVSLDSAIPEATRVNEAWGGISYIPANRPGGGRLVVAGWFVNPPNAADGFVMLYENLDRARPTIRNRQVITGPGFSADWALGNTVDSDGNIYVVGYTTGSLGGTHRGKGDGYIAKYDSELNNPVFRQFGTEASERYRKIEIDDKTGTLYVSGFTYGNYAGVNRADDGLSADIIIQQFDTDLNRINTVQIGTPYEERGYLTVQDDYLFVGGMTEGSMVETNKGSFDTFLLALDKETLRVTTVDPTAFTNSDDDDLPRNADDDRTELKIFNVISANGDGLNDFFQIQGISRYPDNSLRIYDISGRLVHETSGYGIGDNLFWGTGNRNNVQLKGVFLYVLEYRTETENFQKTGYLIIN